MEQILKNVAEASPKVLIIIVIAVLLYSLGARILNFSIRHIFVGRRASRLSDRDIEKRQDTLANLFVNVWRFGVAVVAILSILRLFLTDAELAPLFASAGIIGVAIGFGAQSLVKDFLSGIFIISENQYRVGDVVEIDNASGTVERIGTRSTVLRDVDGNVHYIPNGIVQHVMNKTMGFSRARFELAIDPSENIDEVAATINKIGEEIAKDPDWKAKILEAPKFIMVSDFTATAITVVVSGKTQPSDQWSVNAEMRRRIIEEFERGDIKLGIQTQAVSVKKPKASTKKR